MKFKIQHLSKYIFLLGLVFFLSSLKKLDSVTGKVVDKNNNPLIGFVIKSELGKNSIKTDKNGDFEIDVEIGSKIFVIDPKNNNVESYLVESKNLGKLIFRYSINKEAVKSKSKLPTPPEPEEFEELIDSGESLDEVVVSGFGSSSSKSESTLSVSEVMPEADAMSGRVAGVEVPTSSAPAKMESLKSRARSKTKRSEKAASYKERKETRKGEVLTDDKKAFKEGVKAGILTAGEVNDFNYWQYWKDIPENDLKQYKNQWNLNPYLRYSVILKTEKSYPIINETVYLKTKDGRILWEAKTDNLGKAELWLNPFNEEELNQDFTITTFNELLTNRAIPYNQGVNSFEIKQDCNNIDKADIAFIFDATGSMSDELEYLKNEFVDVIQKTKEAVELEDIKIGSVFYRDTTDEYLTRYFPLTNNVNEVQEFISNQKANGGGDYPEAVLDGLEIGLDLMEWRDDSLVKIAFLILDAPFNNEENERLRYNTLIEQYARKGIKIIPIVGSGIKKDAEFLMRSTALLTNGTYLFLTDDSGVGNEHIKPTTDSFKVELLNDLIIRVMKQYTFQPSCFKKLKENNAPTNLKLDKQLKIGAKNEIKFAPNPTKRYVNIKSSLVMNEIHLYDLSGKLLQQIKIENKRNYKLDLGAYPLGVYYVKANTTKGWESSKIIKN